MGETRNIQEHQHFLKEVEQAIRVANREVMHQTIAPISQETIIPFAVTVAKLRERYIGEAFKLGGDRKANIPDDDEIKNLRRYREAYAEARDAFEALMVAIERGYVDLAKD